MDTSTKLQLASIGLLAGVMATTTMNTCAVDRLEQQVILNRKAVEKLESRGGGGGATVTTVAASGAAMPGSSTGMTEVGWGGASAEILHVEGALPGAPLSIAQKPKPQNDTYVNRRSSAPSSLNFYATGEGDARTVFAYSMDRLLQVDPDAPPAVLPGLATRWEVSEDKLTYTYHLRQGVQFADGRPFSADDVLFSFNVLRDPEVKADHLRSAFDSVVEMSKSGPYTVVVRYREPNWKGLYTIGYELYILNKGWYEDNIPKYAERLDIAEYAVEPGRPGFGEVFNKIRIPAPGTGPYMYSHDEYDPDKVELEQNPFSWRTQIEPEFYNFKKLKWVYITDPVAAFEAFRKEQFDITVVDFNAWDDEYSKDPTITELAVYQEYSHTGSGFSYLAWNTREAPFDDPRVRKAMAHLTNRAWMLEEIERGRGQIATCPSKPNYPMYHPDMEPLAYDLDEAKRLLTEAGWTDSDGDGVLDRDGERFEFELKLGSGRRYYAQVSGQLEDACKKVGIRMTTRTLEWSTFIEDYYERRFDAVSLYASFADPWIDSYEEFHSSQDVPRGGNSSGWKNERADTLLADMRGEFDEDKRNEMYWEFCEQFQNEQPYTLLTHGMVGVLVHKRLRGAKVRPTGMKIHEMWVPVEETLYE